MFEGKFIFGPSPTLVKDVWSDCIHRWNKGGKKVLNSAFQKQWSRWRMRKRAWGVGIWTKLINGRLFSRRILHKVLLHKSWASIKSSMKYHVHFHGIILRRHLHFSSQGTAYKCRHIYTSCTIHLSTKTWQLFRFTACSFGGSCMNAKCKMFEMQRNSDKLSWPNGKVK